MHTERSAHTPNTSAKLLSAKTPTSVFFLQLSPRVVKPHPTNLNMGGALSCISDNNREQAAHSLSKEHPGRAEAIAEYKARKNAGYLAKKAAKEAAAAGTAAEKDVANGAADATTKPEDTEIVEERKLPELTTEEEKPEETVEQPIEEADQKTPDEVVTEDVEMAIDDPVDAQTDDPEESTEKIDDMPTEEKPDEAGAVEDAVATPVAPIPDADVDATPADEPVADVDTVKAEEVEANALAADEEPKEPFLDDGVMATASSEVQLLDDSPKGLIDSRRAMFENSPDNLPEAKEIKYDVLDPVTGERVTLVEYRERQKERMQGVVKLHAAKYEDLDEQALKELETKKLQDETRKREVRSWTKPDTTSNPSSPIEPRRMGDLELPQ